MCKAFDDHFENGRQLGISQGISQGKEMLLIAQIKDGEISIENAAKRMDMTPKEFADKYKLSLK